MASQSFKSTPGKAVAPVSLWDTSALEAPIDNPMVGDLQTDVAIVGAGFTGLSTALHLARAGVDAHVLEAKQIGFGGSGRNVGLVNAGLWLPPQDVVYRLGEHYGGQLIRQLGEAPDYIFSLIEEHDIQCEASRSGTIHAAHSRRGFEDLQRRAKEWHRLGAPVELLSRDHAAEKIGTSVFHGGLLDHRAGTINPMGFVRGLARIATAAGAGLTTESPVRSLMRHGDRWLLQTNAGTVTAKTVVLGTNAYTDDLWPRLKQCFTMIHFYQFATKPLGHRVTDILPDIRGIWDTGSIMFSLRRDKFNRLVVGSMGKVIGGENGLSRKWAATRLLRLFPDLGNVEFETGWHGQIAMTSDHLPRIFQLGEGLYTPIGYNGRGITTGTIFGRAMAEYLTGGKEENLPVPVTPCSTSATAPIMSRVYEAAFKANQLIKAI